MAHLGCEQQVQVFAQEAAVRVKVFKQTSIDSHRGGLHASMAAEPARKHPHLQFCAAL